MRSALLFVLILSGASPCFGAESYPGKAVRVIAPSAPGGTTDLTARVISQQLSEQLGKSFVVDNRTGAAGIIAYGIAAKSAPDGYTLMLAESTFSMLPSLSKSLPFDIDKDFTPITQILRAPSALVVNPSLNVNALKELIALAQANPGKLNYGSAGPNSAINLHSALFNMRAKTHIVHIPYKGGGEMISALLGGQVQMVIAAIPTVLALVKSGKLRALAVTTDGKRSPIMPDVPSMSEAGVSMAVYGWFGLSGPAGMPKEVVDKLHGEVLKALTVASVKERFVPLGGEMVGSSPNEFARHIRSEHRHWAEVIKSAGITPD